MWFSFAVALCVACILLFIPGFIVSLASGIDVKMSFSISAPISITIFACTGIALGIVQLYGVASMLVCSLVISAIVALLILLFRLLKYNVSIVSLYKTHKVSSGLRWRWLALYIVVGMAIMSYLFLRCLPSADALVQFGDNDFHVNVIKSIADGGNYSTLAVSSYPISLEENEIPVQNAGYYPAAWHVFAALIMTITGTTAPLVENVVNYLFLAIVFPLGCSAFLQRVSNGNKILIILGSFAVAASAAFPLRPLVVHQIYPNIAAFSCIPIAVYLMILWFETILQKKNVLPIIFALVLVVLGVSLLHPNVIFALLLYCIAYLLFSFNKRYISRFPKLKSHYLASFTILEICTIGIFVVVWLILLNSPAFASIAGFLWEWTITAPQALLNIVTMGLCLGVSQYFLALFVLIGFVYCIYKSEYRWIAFAFVLTAAVFFFNAAGDPTIKRLFAGFWYTDPERTAALTAIAAVPLTSMGLMVVSRGLYKLLIHIGPFARYKRTINALSAITITVIFMLNYVPHELISDKIGASAFEVTRWQLKGWSNPDVQLLYSQDEMDFVEEVKKLIGPDDLVLNMPYDGSVFAYANDDLNTYYKSHVDANDTEDSVVIRTRLKDFESDAQVKDIVGQTGSKYVLKLHTNPESNYDRNAWKPEEWSGIEELGDSTPGFEVVLAEDDMRLYKIDAA